MRASNLDQSITIQALTSGQDTNTGAETETWATASGEPPQWAQYIPMRGVERIEAGKVATHGPLKLRIRRWTALTTKHRIVHGSKTYKIYGIEDNQRDGDMVLSCEEVT